MAIKTFKASGSGSANKTKMSNRYAGPVPPAGAYRCVIKRMTIQLNKNNDPMITALFEIAEEGSNKKYNGYGFFENFNITDQGAPFVNQFLLAMVGDNAFAQKQVIDGLWDQGIKAKPDDRNPKVYHIRKIGETFVGSPEKLDFALIVSTDKGVIGAGANKGKETLNATGYKALSNDDEDEEELDEDFEEIEDDEDEEVEDEATDSEEPEEDDEEVDDEDDEDEELF